MVKVKTSKIKKNDAYNVTETDRYFIPTTILYYIGHYSENQSSALFLTNENVPLLIGLVTQLFSVKIVNIFVPINFNICH